MSSESSTGGDISQFFALICKNCGNTAPIQDPCRLEKCCKIGKERNGIMGSFNSVAFNPDGTLSTSIHGSNITVCPKTSGEKEFVESLKTFYSNSSVATSLETRMEMFEKLRDFHYKSFWETFKEENNESTITVDELRKLLENR
jgi:hypothetical protein